MSARLPHVIGADPDDGIGADCLIMSHKVRVSAGLPTPPLNQGWFGKAQAGEWDELYAEWNSLLEECDPEPYCFVLHLQPGGLIGVGVIIDHGVLIVHHRRGVQWLPMAVARRIIDPLTFWKPKDASI